MRGVLYPSETIDMKTRSKFLKFQIVYIEKEIVNSLVELENEQDYDRQ